MSIVSRFSLPLCLLTLVCSACGGGGQAPEAKTADDTEAEQGDAPEESGMNASAEIGALDERQVTKTFENALDSLQSCLHEGASRVELLGGEIAFYVEVDESGHAQHVHATRSTIGDRETERCMLDALRAEAWPKPQGGLKGLARNSFDFDMPNDVRPPVMWDGGQVSETVSEMRGKLSECGRASDLIATVYVNTDGTALAAGVSGEDPSAEQAADCVSDVLRDAKYPSPGSWPAKVTFRL
jgi:hypothetical protein